MIFKSAKVSNLAALLFLFIFSYIYKYIKLYNVNLPDSAGEVTAVPIGPAWAVRRQAQGLAAILGKRAGKAVAGHKPFDDGLLPEAFVRADLHPRQEPARFVLSDAAGKE